MTIDINQLKELAERATQYEVNWSSGCVGTDDLSLYANSHRDYFQTETAAKEFINTLPKIPNPRFQPSIHKRVKLCCVEPQDILTLHKVIETQWVALEYYAAIDTVRIQQEDISLVQTAYGPATAIGKTARTALTACRELIGDKK